MRIQEFKDQESVATVLRFNTMIERIRGSEAKIMAESDRILGRSSRASFQPRSIIAADLPELILAERMIGKTNDIVSIEFLEAGLIAKRPVGKLSDGNGSFGTGFLVGLDLMMTAAHCIPTEADASVHEFILDDEENTLGEAKGAKRYDLDPSRFYFRSEEFDVALVAIADFTGNNPPVRSFGWHILAPKDEEVRPPDPVSIIQHPSGEPKRIVVHNSRFVHRDNNTASDRLCWYTGDTYKGSSGAPVFNPKWEIVALHHRAIPQTDSMGAILGKDGKPISLAGKIVKDLDDLSEIEEVAFLANQGVRASRIHSMLAGKSMENPTMDQIRSELVELWSSPGAWKIAQAAAGRGSSPHI